MAARGGARNPEAVTLKGVVPLKLDVTNDEDVVAAACAAGNVNLLVNNAGIARAGGFLADGAVAAATQRGKTNTALSAMEGQCARHVRRSLVSERGRRLAGSPQGRARHSGR